jgi:hypothetical protein
LDILRFVERGPDHRRGLGLTDDEGQLHYEPDKLGPEGVCSVFAFLEDLALSIDESFDHYAELIHVKVIAILRPPASCHLSQSRMLEIWTVGGHTLN